MLHGPVMVDVAGTELSDADRELLLHPAAGGVILFARNFESPQQLYRLVGQIHELRSPSLLIAVDQEGGRVQRFCDGLTRLPAAAQYWRRAEGDMQAARRTAHEIGWLMATELRALGVDFSFAPVVDLDLGVSEVIGDRAFADTPERVAQLASAWAAGAREAGMISVAKHFPGHGSVVADSHTDLPVDPRALDEIVDTDLAAFARMLKSGVEAVMPAHVVFNACDSKPAGFSKFWLQDVLRGRLTFSGAIFSDDLSMAAAADAGCYADRANAALDAGCDMVLVCNQPDGAREVLDALRDYHDPVAQSRTARLHGKARVEFDALPRNPRWRNAVALAARLADGADTQESDDSG